MRNKVLLVILIVLCLVIVLTYPHVANRSLYNTRTLSRSHQKIKSASGTISFRRKDFVYAHKHHLQYLKKYIKFPTTFTFPKVVKSLLSMDMSPNAKVEIETAYVTPKGFMLYIYPWGSNTWKRHWRIDINWLVYDDNMVNHKVQSGSNVVYHQHLNKRLFKNHRVKFPKPFSTVPKVALFLTGWAAADSNIKMYARNITKQGFDIKVVNHRNKAYWWFIYDYVASTTKDVEVHRYVKGCWPSNKKKCSGINKVRKSGYSHLTFNTPPGKVRLSGHSQLDYSGNLRSVISNNTSGRNKITTWSKTKLWLPTVSTVVFK